MTDDIIKRLREAIAAGPTPGPWSAHGTAVWMAGHGGFDLYHGPSPHSNAKYIAAASPDNIAALLDRLDEAREAARTWENEAERRSRRYEECAVKLDKAERENERLREDAERFNALLMLVVRKYPGESRYETACRYIREAENQEVSGPKIDAAMAAEQREWSEE